MNSWADQVDEEDRSNRLQNDWRGSRYDYAQDQRPNWRQNKAADVERSSSWRSQSELLAAEQATLGGRPAHQAPAAPGPSQPVKILKRPDGPKQQQPWVESPVNSHSHSPLGDGPLAGRAYGAAQGQGPQPPSRSGRMSGSSLQGPHIRNLGASGDYGPGHSTEAPNSQGPPNTMTAPPSFTSQHSSQSMGRPLASSQARPTHVPQESGTQRTSQIAPSMPSTNRTGAPMNHNHRMDQGSGQPAQQASVPRGLTHPQQQSMGQGAMHSQQQSMGQGAMHPQQQAMGQSAAMHPQQQSIAQGAMHSQQQSMGQGAMHPQQQGMGQGGMHSQLHQPAASTAPNVGGRGPPQMAMRGPAPDAGPSPSHWPPNPAAAMGMDPQRAAAAAMGMDPQRAAAAAMGMDPQRAAAAAMGMDPQRAAAAAMGMDPQRAAAAAMGMDPQRAAAAAMGMDPQRAAAAAMGMDPQRAATMQMPPPGHSMQPPHGVNRLPDFPHMTPDGSSHNTPLPPPPRAPQNPQQHPHMHSQPHHTPAQPHQIQTQLHPGSGGTTMSVPPTSDYPPQPLPPVRTSSATPSQDASQTPKSATHPSANGSAPALPGMFGGPMSSGSMPVDFSQMGGPRVPGLTGQPADLMHQMMMFAQMGYGVPGMPMMPPGQMDRGNQPVAPPSIGYQGPPGQPPDGNLPPPPPPPQPRSAQPNPNSAAPTSSSSAPAFPPPPPVPATAATVAHIENTAIQQADLYQQLESMKKQSMQQSHALQYVMTYMQYLLPQFQALQARNQQLERDNQQLSLQQQQQSQQQQQQQPPAMVSNVHDVVRNMGQMTLQEEDGGDLSSPCGPPPHIEASSSSSDPAPPGFSKPMAGHQNASRHPALNPTDDRSRRRGGEAEAETNGEMWGGRGAGASSVPPLPRHHRNYHEDGIDDGQSSTARTINSHADDEREGSYRRGGKAGPRRGGRGGDADLVLEVPRPVTPQTPTPRSGRERTATGRTSPGDRRGVNSTATRSRRRGGGQDLLGAPSDPLPVHPSAAGKSSRAAADHAKVSQDNDAPPPGFSKQSTVGRPNGLPLKERDSHRDKDLHSDRESLQHDREPQREREANKNRDAVSNINAVDLQSKISNLLRPVGSGKLQGGESTEAASVASSAADRGGKGASRFNDSRTVDEEALPERARRERRKQGGTKSESQQYSATDSGLSPRPTGNMHDSGAGSERERRRRMPLQLYTPPKRGVGEGEGKGNGGDNAAPATAKASS